MSKTGSKTTTVSCCKHECIVCESHEINGYATRPTECADNELRALFSYFLYDAPCITSKFSRKIGRIHHSAIFDDLCTSRHLKMNIICAASAKIDEKLTKANLLGERLCLKCSRFVCKRKDKNSLGILETDLECLLRHIRNSIAHGNVYYFPMSNKHKVMFEDFNKKGNKSARIVCNKTDLKQWKSILTKAVKIYSISTP